MASPRTILHADMDAFYAAVEQRDNPDLRGKPVIVGGLGRRGVVSTASYEAREFGVHSALPSSIAQRRCPEGIFVRPRMKVYAAISRQIRAVFEEFTPLVEPLSLDEAFLDVTGSLLLFGDGRAIAERIKQLVFECTELRISIGVAASKYVAKVASDLEKPDGLVVVEPGTEAEFLGALGVKRLWGAGKKTQERFASLGLKTIADVQALSEASLVSFFGESSGRHYWWLCRGLDDRPVEPGRDVKSISHEVTFPDDIRDTERLHRILLELAERVGRRLRRAALKGRTVRLKLRYPPFVTLTRQVRLESPTQDDREIHESARELFDAARSGERPVRLIGVGVADLVSEKAARQKTLFSPADKSRKALDAIDRIRERFGDAAIGHGLRDATDASSDA